MKFLTIRWNKTNVLTKVLTSVDLHEEVLLQLSIRIFCAIAEIIIFFIIFSKDRFKDVEYVEYRFTVAA